MTISEWLEEVFGGDKRPIKPGPWYPAYHADGGHGGFGVDAAGGDLWMTGDPEFDKEWVRLHGFRELKRWAYKEWPPKDEWLIGDLGPGESVTIRLTTPEAR